MEDSINQKNEIVIKLLHYFITDLNYNPIILQGIENEIWLENLDCDYKVVRIVSSHIHNEEQMQFDVYKTKRIMSKIKAKTFSFHLPTLSIYTDLGDDLALPEEKSIDSMYLDSEKDLNKYQDVLKHLPDITKKMEFNEEGMQLFLKITNDINRKNLSDAKRNQEVFEPKVPVVTYALIGANVVIFLLMMLSGHFNYITNLFCNYGDAVRAGQYYRLFTSAFIHGGLLHLVVNMYSLYIVGSQVESYMGKFKFCIIYLFSALAGSLLSITVSSYASVGASGAIFGLLGSLLYFGYHYRVYLGNVLRSQIIPLIIVNLLLGFMVPGIDNFAHIGGLIGGLLMTLALGVKYKSSTFEKVNGWIVLILFTAFLGYMAIFAAH